MGTRRAFVLETHLGARAGGLSRRLRSWCFSPLGLREFLHYRNAPRSFPFAGASGTPSGIVIVERNLVNGTANECHLLPDLKASAAGFRLGLISRYDLDVHDAQISSPAPLKSTPKASYPQKRDFCKSVRLPFRATKSREHSHHSRRQCPISCRLRHPNITCLTPSESPE
jgi:hypothetical protein